MYNIEVDDRLTDEMKNYARISYKTILLGQFIGLNMYRKLIDMTLDVKRDTKLYNFVGLTFEEYSVPSIYDDHKIRITVYIPQNRNPDTAICIYMHGESFVKI